MMRRVTKQGMTRVEIVAFVASALALAYVLLGLGVLPRFHLCRYHLPCPFTHCGGKYSACQSNVKNISTALEMYATDNDGHFPPTGRLGLLVSGNYLKTSLPKCPATGFPTYEIRYRAVTKPEDSYSFGCFGSNHPEVLGEGNMGPWCEDGQVYRMRPRR